MEARRRGLLRSRAGRFAGAPRHASGRSPAARWGLGHRLAWNLDQRPVRVAAFAQLEQTRVVSPEQDVPSEKRIPSDAELSSVVGQLDALLERIGELLSHGGDGDRTDDTAGLLEVERHLRGARRELGRTRRRLR